MPIYQDEFWGSNAKACVTYPINANVAIIISDQKSNPAGLNLEFEMSVLSDLGGHWDAFFLNEVIA